MSDASPVTRSPDGVPGAVTDPASVVGEDLTFAGAGGTQINGYLVRAATANTLGPPTARPATTDANLTGPITSNGNATTIAAQTGTGSTFVMNTSPAFSGSVTMPGANEGRSSSTDPSSARSSTAWRW